MRKVGTPICGDFIFVLNRCALHFAGCIWGLLSRNRSDRLSLFMFTREACCLRRGIVTPGSWHRDLRSQRDVSLTSAVKFPGGLSGRDHDPTPADCRGRHAKSACAGLPVPHVTAEYTSGISALGRPRATGDAVSPRDALKNRQHQGHLGTYQLMLPSGYGTGRASITWKLLFLFRLIGRI